ncbi:MAG TPA: septation protein SepH, partial [Segeticoccus sp.]|uniref:septation protein SepH n=1 Tax=Segeticoccus sp. TaxID=2706531 RepID=UPI002D7FA78F
MQDLRLIGVHEDGQHLLLGADDGTRFRLPLSDDLRAAVRRGRPRQGHLPVEVEGGLRPRDVQALIRAGASAEDVADQAGWSVDKVRRYEGPILAEREHVAQLARAVRVRGRAQGGVAPTLDSRTTERLSDRGVNPTHAYWDAHRVEHGPWTVVVTFPAGGRERQASWHFDLPDRTITPLDDEARWLSGDDDAASTGPLPAPRVPPTGRSTRVYDVEAEGGLRATERSGDSGAGAAGRSGEDAASPGQPGKAGGGPSGREEPVDLMTAMRERSAASRASRRRRRNRRSPADVPQADPQPPEDALPLEDIPYATVTAD